MKKKPEKLTTLVQYIQWDVPLLLLAILTTVGCVHATCQSHQFAEVGETGTIKCDFDLNTYNVYWCKDECNKTPFIRYEYGSVPPISGSGFNNFNYSIDQSGSLIIFDVTTNDDGNYTVKSYNRNDKTLGIHLVALHTHGACRQELPLISYCGSQNTCLVDSDKFEFLSCSLECSRPAIELTFYIKHEGYNETIEVNSTGESGTAIIVTSSFEMNKYVKDPLTQFVCEARGPALGTRVLQSTIFIDKSNGWDYNGATTKYYTINSRAILPCAENSEPATFIWEKITGHNRGLIMFTESGRQHISTADSQRYVNERFALVLQQVDLTDEGKYRCKIFDGEHYSVYEQTVTVLVPPSPPYILSDGCEQTTGQCTVEVGIGTVNVSLTCSINEVYPQLSLQFENNFPLEIKLWNQTTSTIARNNRFYVTVTATLQPLESYNCKEEKFIVCRALGIGASAMVNTEKKIKLSLERCPVDIDTENTHRVMAITVVTVILCAMLIVTNILMVSRSRSRSHRRLDRGYIQAFTRQI
ncbi:uncharacterized protein [Apostichopus japonicus]|uniref:uncharacterized protein n=1 Tax=Stichopus japonicus TaxID=307972 RepID=UPI003AB1AF38